MKRDSTAYGAVRPAYDKNDCSVRAIMIAAGCTYEHASAMFSVAGRRLLKGTPSEVTQCVHEKYLGMERITDVKGWPIAAFLAAHPHGSYVLHRSGHAFAIIEGVLHDWERGTGPRSMILAAWKATEVTKAKIAATKELFE
tara:strand:- start:51 stop:473 length:423 start_codon:yes stop_codon:yes gene_type:complete